MVQWLNNACALALAVCFTSAASAQSVSETNSKDYKDAKTHEKFRKRRMAVSAWQINQLKQGALVVRLKTSSHLINGLKKRGDDIQAEKARIEQLAINKNYMRAFLDKYSFSKMYFIYSNSSDSLLKGARSGIFVDTTMRVNPAISMSEKFYLLAETDFIYNSSIGFVPEDSAATVVEQGNPSSSEAPVIVKNKYGHQLKDPFPFSQEKLVYPKALQVVYVNVENKTIPFSVRGIFADNGIRTNDKENGSPTHVINGQKVELSIPRMATYEVLNEVVSAFNANLNDFYRRSAHMESDEGKDEDAKRFYY